MEIKTAIKPYQFVTLMKHLLDSNWKIADQPEYPHQMQIAAFWYKHDSKSNVLNTDFLNPVRVFIASPMLEVTHPKTINVLSIVGDK